MVTLLTSSAIKTASTASSNVPPLTMASTTTTTTTTPTLYRRHFQFPITVLFLLLLCFPDVSYAQSDKNPPPPPYALSGKFNPSMAIIIVILMTAFFFMGFFSIYLRQCGGDREGSIAGRTAATAARSRRAKGLDQAVIEKFPLLMYSDVKELKIGQGTLECAVCLCEFEDDEMLRLLPKCSHAFHPDCIGMWLASHTTCPVCRANLAVDPDAPMPSLSVEGAGEAVPVAQAEGSRRGGEETEAERPDHVAIEVAEDATAEGERRPEMIPPLEIGRVGSKRGRGILSWRSRSARPEIGARMGQYWAEEERERFTLRLPESVRQEVIAGKLSRSVSSAVLSGEGSSRRGYRGGGGEGSSRGGRGFKMGRWDWATKSDRWAFLARPLSFKLSRGGGGGVDGEGSTKRGRGEGSTKRGDAVGEGSTTRGKVFPGVRGPLDCLGGGGGGAKAEEIDESSSTVAFAKV